MTVTTARQAYYEIEGLPGYWNKSGGDTEKASSTTSLPGPGNRQVQLSGPVTTSNLVLTRQFDAAADADAVRETVIRRLQNGDWRTTVHGHYEDPEVGQVGRPWTYAEALLVGNAGMDADSNSGDPLMLSYTFAVSGLS